MVGHSILDVWQTCNMQALGKSASKEMSSVQMVNVVEGPILAV